MILCVCMNPCIDKTVEIDEFKYGGMNRIQTKRVDASGKAVNVAIAANRLDLDAVLTGFACKNGSDMLIARLDAERVKRDLTFIDGDIRVNTKVFDRKSKIITEINEPGVAVDARDIAAIKEKITKLSSDAEYMVLTGSVPPGCETDFYKSVTIDASNVKTILDAEGELFTLGLQASPYMVKPNKFELETYVKRELNDIAEIKKAAYKILDAGVEIVLVSLGGEGAFVTDGADDFFSPAVKLKPLSTVGAGDSMLVGMLYGLKSGFSLSESFKNACAAGAAAVMTEGTGLVDKAGLGYYYNKIEIERL